MTKYKCTRCGECCKGSPRLNKEDADRIIKLGIKREFFVENINGVNYMKLEGEQCVFLEKDGKKRYACKIYDSRPRICRLYPAGKNCQPKKWFFDEYLERRKNELQDEQN